MGLIYVNPEGPNGNPDPLASARDIRETFGRMAMNDEETVALIAGGHTFGKTHGAGPAENVGPDPEAAPIELQGLGWKSSYGTGVGADAITSGLEVTWTYTPTAWDNSFFQILFGYEWELTKSPAGAHQWRPKDGAGHRHRAGRVRPGQARSRPMLTTDLALRFDPIYEPISRRFVEDPDAFADAFARAWFKLTHRDMGPIVRYLGPEVPTEELIWQDPLPAVDARARSTPPTSPRSRRRSSPPACRSRSWCPTAWASASSFRGSDKRGGANGARIRLEPQSGWEVNNPDELATVLRVLEGIQPRFNAAHAGGKQVSLADLIVLAGGAGVEKAAADAGFEVEVPFTPGRVDASPGADRRRVVRGARAEGGRVPQLPRQGQPAAGRVPADRQGEPAHADRAGDDRAGRRPAGARRELRQVQARRAHRHPGPLTNDFFVNLLDFDTTWKPVAEDASTFEGRNAAGEVMWTGTRVDLVFGSNSELRAVAEVYASDDAKEKFVADFVAAWVQGHGPRPVRPGLTRPEHHLSINKGRPGRPSRSAWASSRWPTGGARPGSGHGVGDQLGRPSADPEDARAARRDQHRVARDGDGRVGRRRAACAGTRSRRWRG